MPPTYMRIKQATRRYRNVTQTVHADTANPDQFTIQTVEDLDPIIQHCKDARENLRPRGQRDMVPVAEVPLFVVEQAMQEGWFNDEDAWKRWLNNPDNRCFRVWEGRV